MENCKTKIKQIILHFLHYYHSKKHIKFYKRLMKINNIPNTFQDGENEWINKWSGLGIKANPIYYRLFYHYIGRDLNIMPEDISHDIIELLLSPPRFSKYYADKNIFDKLFPEGYLPQTILRRMNGFWYNKDYYRINLNNDTLFDILNKSEINRMILKPSIDGMSGRGIKLLEKKEGTWFINNEQLSFEKLQKYSENFIIQKCVNQHKDISKFNPTSINTLRLTLYRSIRDDKCVIPSAILRIGGKGSIVDNAHAGGGYIGINVKTGKLFHKVLDQYGRSQKIFNNINFEDNFIIPNWEKILEFAKSIGYYVPHHRLLALDLILQEDGTPMMLEFNVEYYGMWLFQFTTGSALGEYTDEIIEYCKQSKNKLESQILL